jgi:hypothetical protein
VSFSPRWAPEAERTFNLLKQEAERAAAGRKRSGKSKSSKQEGLFKQVAKTVKLLLNNPRHPGLESHEFYSMRHPFHPSAKIFEAYAQHKTPGAYRVFWCYGPGKQEITIIAITPHP